MQKAIEKRIIQIIKQRPDLNNSRVRDRLPPKGRPSAATIGAFRKKHKLDQLQDTPKRIKKSKPINLRGFSDEELLEAFDPATQARQELQAVVDAGFDGRKVLEKELKNSLPFGRSASRWKAVVRDGSFDKYVFILNNTLIVWTDPEEQKRFIKEHANARPFSYAEHYKGE